jgi:hypothetical protein
MDTRQDRECRPRSATTDLDRENVRASGHRDRRLATRTAIRGGRG